MLKIAIAGVAGRMGKAILQHAFSQNDIVLVGGLVRSNAEKDSMDLGQLIDKPSMGVKTQTLIEDAFRDAEVILDFTLPEICVAHLPYYLRTKKKVIIGGTSFTLEQKNVLKQASTQIPIVFAPNSSIGMNVCYGLVQKAAQILKQYDAEIIEMHHNKKKDAPSGTALALGEAIAKARGQVLQDLQELNRNQCRGKEAIGFASLRAGNVFGEHTVLFADEFERLEISHKTSSREAFAQGALVAARWIANQPSGLYDMQDVLDLK